MTIEQINAKLKTNFSLIKRNGQINDGNARIMKRLANITDAELDEFMRTDKGWNMPASEKHAKGYHALRALDRWYKEHGNGADDGATGNGNGDGDGIHGGGANGNGNGDGHGDGDGGNGNGGNDDGNGGNDDGNGHGDDGADNGADGNGDGGNGDGGNGDGGNGDGGNGDGGNGDGSGADGSGADGSGADGSGADGNGNGADGGNDDGNDDGHGDGNDDGHGDGNGADDGDDDGLTDIEKQVKAMIMRPQADGRPNNVYLHGPAGTGKSYMVKRIAENIGAGYWETGIVSMKEELLGFENINGYVETECLKILKNGIEGKDIVIMNFDEFDGMPNSVSLAFNNIFASRRVSISKIGTFNVHPSVRFVATGNTTMDGADEFYDRENVDTSVKTRWIFKAVDYNKDVEKRLADAETVKFLQGLRRAKDNCGLDLMVTYREFTVLAWAKDVINDGIMTMADALESCVFKGISADDKDTLRSDRMMQKLIENGNAWALAF